MRVDRVLETCLYATDLDAAERFYASVLGLEPIGRQAGRHVFFRCGAGVVLLFNPEETERGGDDVPAHGARGPGHVAFAVPDAEVPVWRSRLERMGVSVEVEITWPRGGGRSLYLRDPAGNSVELASDRLWATFSD